MPLLRPRHRLAAALVLLGATTAAFAGPAVTRSGEAPIRCELDVSRRGGSVELTALAHAAKSARGKYAFHVSGRGTAIRQGGTFAIASGGPEQLGMVTLSAGGSGYDADLTVVVDGKTISCSAQVGGRI